MRTKNCSVFFISLHTSFFSNLTGEEACNNNLETGVHLLVYITCDISVEPHLKILCTISITLHNITIIIIIIQISLK